MIGLLCRAGQRKAVDAAAAGDFVAQEFGVAPAAGVQVEVPRALLCSPALGALRRGASRKGRHRQVRLGGMELQAAGVGKGSPGAQGLLEGAQGRRGCVGHSQGPVAVLGQRRCVLQSRGHVKLHLRGSRGISGSSAPTALGAEQQQQQKQKKQQPKKKKEEEKKKQQQQQQKKENQEGEEEEEEEEKHCKQTGK